LKRLLPGEITLNELEIGSEIGSGTYGRVCVGKWKNKYRVALKFCQNRGKIDEFMREANLMISLPPHPNVVRMFGVCFEGTQPIIVMEYCSGGLSVNMKETNKQTNTSQFISLSQLFKLTHTQSHTNSLRILIVLFLSFSHLCD
jgi:serine/threonine protein kinase